MQTTFAKILSLAPSDSLEEWDKYEDWNTLLAQCGKQDLSVSELLLDDGSISFKKIFEYTNLEFALYCLRVEPHLYPICLAMIRAFAEEAKPLISDEEVLELYTEATTGDKAGGGIETFMAGVQVISKIEQAYLSTKTPKQEIYAMRALVFALCNPIKAPFASQVSALTLKATEVERIEEKLEKKFLDFFGKEFLSDDLFEEFASRCNVDPISNQELLSQASGISNEVKTQSQATSQAPQQSPPPQSSSDPLG